MDFKMSLLFIFVCIYGIHINSWAGHADHIGHKGYKYHGESMSGLQGPVTSIQHNVITHVSHVHNHSEAKRDFSITISNTTIEEKVDKLTRAANENISSSGTVTETFTVVEEIKIEDTESKKSNPCRCYTLKLTENIKYSDRYRIVGIGWNCGDHPAGSNGEIWYDQPKKIEEVVKHPEEKAVFWSDFELGGHWGQSKNKDTDCYDPKLERDGHH